MRLLPFRPRGTAKWPPPTALSRGRGRVSQNGSSKPGQADEAHSPDGKQESRPSGGVRAHRWPMGQGPPREGAAARAELQPGEPRVWGERNARGAAAGRCSLAIGTLAVGYFPRFIFV